MPIFRPASYESAGFATGPPLRHQHSWQSPWRVDGFGQVGIATARPDLLLLGFDINAVTARSIETKNLGFRLHRQNRTGLLGDVGRNFECHELVDQPLRRPDAVVAAVKDLVRSNPEQELGNDVSKISRARM